MPTKACKAVKLRTSLHSNQDPSKTTPNNSKSLESPQSIIFRDLLKKISLIFYYSSDNS